MIKQSKQGFYESSDLRRAPKWKLAELKALNNRIIRDRLLINVPNETVENSGRIHL
jgi:hypothetical protein